MRFIFSVFFAAVISAQPNEDQREINNLNCEHCSHCYHEYLVDTHFGVQGNFKTLDVSYDDDAWDLKAPEKCDTCLGNQHRSISFLLNRLPLTDYCEAVWISNPNGIATALFFDRRYVTTNAVSALNSSFVGWVDPCDPTLGNPASTMCSTSASEGDPAYWAGWDIGDARNSFNLILTGCDYWPEKKELSQTRIMAKFPGNNWLEFQVGSSDLDDCFFAHVSPDCQDPPSLTPVYKSVAQRFVALCLSAIRREIPDPTLHARNLFHLSAAMWDAWVAYENTYQTTGFLFRNVRQPPNAMHREKAIAFAGYSILSHRYVSNTETLDELDSAMADLGYALDDTSTPANIGTGVAQAIIDFGMNDGSNEENNFADTTNYQSENEPLFLNTSGTVMNDPNRWQPLAFDNFITQNEIEIGAFTQTFQGPQWGYVEPFALDDTVDLTLVNGLPVWMDRGPPPSIDSVEGKENILEVIRLNSFLDMYDATMMNISPCCMHNSTLGTNDGAGYNINPVTNLPYFDREVARADYGRVVAEFWADGPESETPPGHWNVIAQQIRENANFEGKWRGTGDPLDPLEWDIKSSFILNGALHDAAIAAWSHKRAYDYSRPISQIRFMGAKGQSTEPSRASYDASGLPLQDGLVEEITAESSATGERHEHLAASLGQVAVRNWRPPSANGVEWILAEDWLPYQKSTFVTPAFPGYVSGHSAFSRAAAEVLANITGFKFAPGGLYEHLEKAGDLEFDYGALTDVYLSHATYFDAADEAGRSRLYGGIHPEQDDFPGRILGSLVGLRACEAADRYFETPAPEPLTDTPSTRPTGPPTNRPTNRPTDPPTNPPTERPTVPPAPGSSSQGPEGSE